MTEEWWNAQDEDEEWQQFWETKQREEDYEKQERSDDRRDIKERTFSSKA